MEWVEVTAKTVEQAKEAALDRLGIGVDDAEFDVVEEPRSGLFGRMRGAARVRARVRPTQVRPKYDRRARRRTDRSDGDRRDTASGSRQSATSADSGAEASTVGGGSRARRRRSRRRSSGAAKKRDTVQSVPAGADEDGGTQEGITTMDERADGPEAAVVNVGDVSAAAERFATGLVEAFRLDATTSAVVDGNEIEIRINGSGDGVGLLIGPSGRTLLAIQDLARVAAQRRLGDHETRLRLDVAGYREKRREALERFAHNVAEMVKESGIARSLEPMPSSDRKVIHDTLATIDGVVSRSEGEDPYRRIVVSPE